MPFNVDSQVPLSYIGKVWKWESNLFPECVQTWPPRPIYDLRLIVSLKGRCSNNKIILINFFFSKFEDVEYKFDYALSIDSHFSFCFLYIDSMLFGVFLKSFNLDS